jgi:predicted DNA-binding transcriptional regulator AlpA
MNLLTIKQVAEKLSCHTSWVWQLSREVPEFPKPVSISIAAANPSGVGNRGRRWIDSDIDAWVRGLQTKTEVLPDDDGNDDDDTTPDGREPAAVDQA